MTNCSPTTKRHINDYMRRLQFSGYDKEFRYYNSAKKAYEKLIEDPSNGTRPLHRPKEWKRKERKAEKEAKKKTWYKRGDTESVI